MLVLMGPKPPGLAGASVMPFWPFGAAAFPAAFVPIRLP